jgi:hypothetical protein
MGTYTRHNFKKRIADGTAPKGHGNTKGVESSDGVPQGNGLPTVHLKVEGDSWSIQNKHRLKPKTKTTLFFTRLFSKSKTKDCFEALTGIAQYTKNTCTCNPSQ